MNFIIIPSQGLVIHNGEDNNIQDMLGRVFWTPTEFIARTRKGWHVFYNADLTDKPHVGLEEEGFCELQ